MPDPITDDEIIYRRVPVSTGAYNPLNQVLSNQAFAPHKVRDSTGISVSRAKYKTIEQAAQGPSTNGYYVVTLRVGDLRKHGIDIVPRPISDDIGHSEIPSLNSGNYKSDEAIALESLLVTLKISVSGPFAASSE